MDLGLQAQADPEVEILHLNQPTIEQSDLVQYASPDHHCRRRQEVAFVKEQSQPRLFGAIAFERRPWNSPAFIVHILDKRKDCADFWVFIQDLSLLAYLRRQERIVGIEVADKISSGISYAVVGGRARSTVLIVPEQSRYHLRKGVLHSQCHQSKSRP